MIYFILMLTHNVWIAHSNDDKIRSWSCSAQVFDNGWNNYWKLQVKCTKHPSCSGKPARVMITVFFPGGVCASDRAHFDLSGTAFGVMAVPGQEKLLQNAEKIFQNWNYGVQNANPTSVNFNGQLNGEWSKGCKANRFSNFMVYTVKNNCLKPNQKSI